jgi:two-component system, LytTR family, response regulator
MKVSALVVDDEPLARRKLRELVDEVSWMACVGEAADGEAAITAVDALRPDLVFLDIELPGPSGLEVLARVRHRPTVIFTTAYDRYAVAAFELHALDYLLKPFGRARFEVAVERARLTLDAAGSSALERGRQALAAGPLARMFVRDRGRIVPLAVRDVVRLQAEDDYVAVHVGGRAYLVHLPLAELERRLDPERFLRIHRSHVVNLDQVDAFEALPNGRIEVLLRDGTRLVASRTRSRELRSRIV